MSLCCNTPYLARIEKIKGNRNGGYALKKVENTQNEPTGINGNITAQAVQNTQANAAAAQIQNNPAVPQDPKTAQMGEFVLLDGKFPSLPRSEMTDLVNPLYNPTHDEEQRCENSPTGTIVTPVDNLFPDAPLFNVPENPLLPPEYQETLDYTSIQYLNGFYRTQIGRYVKVDYQTTSNNIEHISGYLVGVGINYILLQDSITSNIIAIDSYSIKMFYVYYHYEGLL